jgi:hypothetical protein
MKKHLNYIFAAVAAFAVSLIGGAAHAVVDVQAEGGVQAFSGQLSDSLRAGPAWGVDANLSPDVPLGLELRYQGASNQLFGSGNFFNGARAARVVQNGGEAMAHVSIARNNKSIVEPYVAGGIGLSRYSLSDSVPGYQDDTLGEVPLSVGLNVHPRLRNTPATLSVGIRGDYKVLFSDQFAPTNQTTDYGFFSKQGGDTYRGEITLGGNF